MSLVTLALWNMDIMEDINVMTFTYLSVKQLASSGINWPLALEPTQALA